jgi:carbonic anhydrase/acetyltransferase-like protein (isoleucine patch superfamily)
MIRKNPAGDTPRIDNSAYVDPTAVVIGKVSIGKNVFIGPCAVIRADEPDSEIVISDGCNVQDRVVVHALQGTAVVVGQGTALSHGCIVHGPCRIGAGSFIGFGAVVFRSVLGKKVFAGHLSLTIDVEIPSGRLIPDCGKIGSSVDAKALKRTTGEQAKFIAGVIQMNKSLVKGYKGF